MTNKTNSTTIRATESVWREADTGGYVAEVRGLLDQRTGCHEWVRLGVYGSRAAAVEAIIKSRR
jgi:hypothetical protein